MAAKGCATLPSPRHRAQRREARRHLALRPVQRLEPHREVVERRPGIGLGEASAATCGASACSSASRASSGASRAKTVSTAASFWA